MKLNKKKFTKLIPKDMRIEQYLDSMSKEGTWGSSLEIQALSSILKIQFWVHLEGKDPIIICLCSQPTKVIHLAYYPDKHFDSLTEQPLNSNPSEKDLHSEYSSPQKIDPFFSPSQGISINEKEDTSTEPKKLKVSKTKPENLLSPRLTKNGLPDMRFKINRTQIPQISSLQNTQSNNMELEKLNTQNYTFSKIEKHIPPDDRMTSTSSSTLQHSTFPQLTSENPISPDKWESIKAESTFLSGQLEKNLCKKIEDLSNSISSLKKDYSLLSSRVLNEETTKDIKNQLNTLYDKNAQLELEVNAHKDNLKTSIALIQNKLKETELLKKNIDDENIPGNIPLLLKRTEFLNSQDEEIRKEISSVIENLQTSNQYLSAKVDALKISQDEIFKTGTVYIQENDKFTNDILNIRQDLNSLADNSFSELNSIKSVLNDEDIKVKTLSDKLELFLATKSSQIKDSVVNLPNLEDNNSHMESLLSNLVSKTLQELLNEPLNSIFSQNQSLTDEVHSLKEKLELEILQASEDKQAFHNRILELEKQNTEISQENNDLHQILGAHRNELDSLYHSISLKTFQNSPSNWRRRLLNDQKNYDSDSFNGLATYDIGTESKIMEEEKLDQHSTHVNNNLSDPLSNIDLLEVNKFENNDQSLRRNHYIPKYDRTPSPSNVKPLTIPWRNRILTPIVYELKDFGGDLDLIERILGSREPKPEERNFKLRFIWKNHIIWPSAQQLMQARGSLDSLLHICKHKILLTNNSKKNEHFDDGEFQSSFQEF